MTTGLKPAGVGGGGQMVAQPKKIDILKSVLNADSVQAQFKNALGKNASAFVASIIDLYNGDSKLQMCEPKQVVMEALKAAVLKLPINKALGYAYIIPYNNTKKDPHGGFVKTMEPSFQMGYKGYIQLAMRTGQYRTINADVVYEGELRKVNKLTGEIAFDGEKISDKVVGYFCYFELLNGFSKTLYISLENMALHAKRYSKGIDKKTTTESLQSLANLPINPNSSTVGWMGNFNDMAVKTVIRNLLSKYGYLSIEMQNAISSDFEGDDASTVKSTEHEVAPTIVDADSVDYEEVGEDSRAIEQSKEMEPEDPGY